MGKLTLLAALLPLLGATVGAREQTSRPVVVNLINQHQQQWLDQALVRRQDLAARYATAIKTWSRLNFTRISYTFVQDNSRAMLSQQCSDVPLDALVLRSGHVVIRASHSCIYGEKQLRAAKRQRVISPSDLFELINTELKREPEAIDCLRADFDVPTGLPTKIEFSTCPWFTDGGSTIFVSNIEVTKPP